MEWRLEGDEPRGVDRPWMDLENQPGFGQRAKLVADLVGLLTALLPSSLLSVTDLGCGDGSLLAMLPRHLLAWGYEIGSGDVQAARERGLDVRQGDLLTGLELADGVPMEYGDVLVASEVLEHLDDPQAFLGRLPRRIVVASSPSRETGDWHTPIHSWAWDLAGYRDLFTQSGWRVLYQAECDGGLNTFGGVTGQQRFQAAAAVRSLRPAAHPGGVGGVLRSAPRSGGCR
jgi:SAM-dependent methyltransferase